MDTLRIKAILSAVKNKSLSKAAEEFGYTPSALSHMADSLEAELGVKLLRRTPLGVELSEDGRLLYDRLVAITDAEAALEAAAEELSSLGSRELRIGTYSSISQYILPEILRGFKSLNPEIKVTITVGDTLRGWLRDGRADVIFADEGAHSDGYAWVPIMSDPYFAVLPSGILEGRKSVTREELYAYPYISTNVSALKSYFDESKFPEVTRFLSVDDASVISMVKEGLGVAVLNSLVLGKHPKGVRAVRLLPEISRTLGFAYIARVEKKRSAAEFIKYLSKYKL